MCYHIFIPGITGCRKLAIKLFCPACLANEYLIADFPISRLMASGTALMCDSSIECLPLCTVPPISRAASFVADIASRAALRLCGFRTAVPTVYGSRLLSAVVHHAACRAFRSCLLGARHAAF